MNCGESASRGCRWFCALTGVEGIEPGLPTSVRAADAVLGVEIARFIAVVPDAANRFPRARGGELGVDEAWTIAHVVRGTVDLDRGKAPRAIIAIVDAGGQAYGRIEEQLGLHLACAAAVDSYATARLAGHAVIALLVGKAMSGAFLAHGYQANRLVAIDDPGVVVHAMGQRSAARITRRAAEDLALLAQHCPPMAYDIGTYAEWGLVHALIPRVDADQPRESDIELVRDALNAAIADARSGPRDLSNRLITRPGHTGRRASLLVRERLAAVWDAD